MGVVCRCVGVCMYMSGCAHVRAHLPNWFPSHIRVFDYPCQLEGGQNYQSDKDLQKRWKGSSKKAKEECVTLSWEQWTNCKVHESWQNCSTNFSQWLNPRSCVFSPWPIIQESNRHCSTCSMHCIKQCFTITSQSVGIHYQRSNGEISNTTIAHHARVMFAHCCPITSS